MSKSQNRSEEIWKDRGIWFFKCQQSHNKRSNVQWNEWNLNFQLKILMVRYVNEMKEEIHKQVKKTKQNINKQLNEYNENAKKQLN
jgi:hypothetical protein